MNRKKFFFFFYERGSMGCAPEDMLHTLGVERVGIVLYSGNIAFILSIFCSVVRACVCMEMGCLKS